MEGNVSGVGFSLEIAGVETANYRGREDEDIFSAGPVQEADRTGWINKIQFYVNDSNSDVDRTVLLHIYRDGHVRCERHITPDLLSDIKENIKEIKEYNEYLTPINELINEFIGIHFQGTPTFNRNEFIRDVNSEFEELIQENFDTSRFSEKEDRMYISIIANIGIALCASGVPDSGEFEDIESVDATRLDIDDQNIENFFNRYAYHIHQQSSVDYSELVNHLRYLLGQSWNDPLEVIRHAVQTYDLSP
jgi:hypothetical protein